MNPSSRPLTGLLILASLAVGLASAPARARGLSSGLVYPSASRAALLNPSALTDSPGAVTELQVAQEGMWPLLSATHARPIGPISVGLAVEQLESDLVSAVSAGWARGRLSLGASAGYAFAGRDLILDYGMRLDLGKGFSAGLLLEDLIRFDNAASVGLGFKAGSRLTFEADFRLQYGDRLSELQFVDATLAGVWDANRWLSLKLGVPMAAYPTFEPAWDLFEAGAEIGLSDSLRIVAAYQPMERQQSIATLGVVFR